MFFFMVVFFFFSLLPSQSKDTLTYGSGEEEIGKGLLFMEVYFVTITI